MKFCTDCWNFDRCNAIGRVVDFSVDDGVCRDFDECKPQTNADRIRAMNDEELATFISEIADECERNTECNQHCYGCDIEYCVRESCLKWLQQPTEEDDHA